MSYQSYSTRRAPAGNGNSRHFSSQSSRGRSGGSGRKMGQYIDPSRFVRVAVAAEQEAYIPTHKFSDFDIAPLLHENLAAKKYVTPTPIQDQTIQPGLDGRDIIGLANTGTGKTLAFALPILQHIMTNVKSAALVIAPTRELAQQIDEEFRSIAKRSNITGAILIGGSAMGPQLRDLRNGPQIVIGTPGRIKDHLERGSLNLQYFDHIVLDEVDRMLDMGFVDDVRSILSELAQKRQSFFFSATLDAKVRNLIESFSRDPITVSLKTSDASESVHQDVVRYAGTHEKIDKLHDILMSPEVKKVIVFDETQRSVERLSNDLIDRGFKADAIHGGKTQGQRIRALDRFKKDQVTILVATDVAARGIDVKDVTHVINYSLPQSYDDYVHRIGRAGRAGNIGNALTFINR
jgi:ATP-dependent RNA helicase RhlE